MDEGSARARARRDHEPAGVQRAAYRPATRVSRGPRGPARGAHLPLPDPGRRREPLRPVDGDVERRLRHGGRCARLRGYPLRPRVFFFKQKTAYEIELYIDVP